MKEDAAAYRRLVDNLVGCFLYRHDPEGVYTYVSPSAKAMLGYTEKEFLTHFSEFLTDNPANETVRHHTEDVPENRQVLSHEAEVYHKDGGLRWLELTEVPVRADDGTILAFEGIAHDITDRKKADEELRKSEERYRNFVVNSTEGIYCIDCIPPVPIDLPRDDLVAAINNQAVIVEVNETLAAMYNLTPSDMEGRRAEEFAPYYGERAAAVLDAEHYRVVDKGTLDVDAEGQTVWLVESYHGLVENGKLIRLWGVQRNITEQIKAEAALTKSENQFADLFENLRDGVGIVTPAGEFVGANQAFCTMLGYTLEELRKMNYRELSPEKWHGVEDRYVQQILEKGYSDLYQKELSRKDGSVLPVELHSYIVRDDTGAPSAMVGLVRDITERKLLDDALRTSLDLNKAYDTAVFDQVVKHGIEEAVRLSGSTVGYLHLVSEDQNTIILHSWSESTMKQCTAAADTMHYPVVSAGVWVDCVHRRKPVIHNDYESLPHKKGLPQGHVPIVRDLAVPVLEGERVVAVMGVGNKETDYNRFDVDRVALLAENLWSIIRRSRAEEAQKRLAAVIEQAGEIVVMTDKGGSIQYVNPSFSAITGYSPEEVIGQNPRILNSGMQDEAFYLNMWETISRGEIWKGHLINRRKDGTFFEEEATISPIKNSAGAITNFVAVKRDVTQEMKMEKQVRQSQKMEAIGTLAGGIAHDFNNILAAIMGYTELSLEKMDDRPTSYRNLTQVLNAAHRARDLVQQILAFSRQTEQEKRPMKVIPILKEVCKFLRASLPSTIEINQQIGSMQDLVMSDPTLIHQVIMNLCTNAGHVMRDTGGVLDVIVDTVVLRNDDLLHHPGLSAGHYLKLSVKDTGAGIPPENIDRIFEPYFTTKEQGEGTGLGLAVVHGIVEDHQGEIKVYSEVGAGTTFTVLLPMVEMQDTAPERTKKAEPPGGTERILYIDDEKDLVIIGKTILERLGYRVVAHTVVADALEEFQKEKDAFDLVITDKTMPHFTGFDLAREVKVIRADIPIILCTGFNDEADPEKSRAAGINDIINKPLNKKVLAETIRTVLDRQR